MLVNRGRLLPSISPAVIPAKAGIQRLCFVLPESREKRTKSGFVLLRRPSHFSLRGQREVTKRKATPLPRLTGLRPVRFASGLRGLSTVHPWTDDKLAGIPAGHPAGFPPPGRRCRGDGRAKARARASQNKDEAEARGATRWFALDLALLISAGRWPACSTGPLCGGESGTKRPVGASAGMPMPFRQGRMPCRKARPRLTGLPGLRPGKRQAGWPSLWLLSLGQSRESDSASAGGRNRSCFFQPRNLLNQESLDSRFRGNDDVGGDAIGRGA